jgi:N6-L-threonylcarbamoyladenine synthase
MTKTIRVLGIETSCDETAAAVVENGRHILSNVVTSQVPIHQPYGGVVPELASRAHVETIQGVVESALKGQAPRGSAPFPKNLPVDLIAVTVGPGLVGSLLVGKVVAEMLAWVYQKPIVGVNHLEGHLLSILPGHPDLEPPYLALVVSGGHTEIIHVQDYGKYHILGRTRDDAAGEAFDKVSKLLGLGYPGGPAIDRAAQKGKATAVDFPRSFLGEGFDFSFSGLKTSVLYHVRDHPDILASKKKIADICASFQAAVVEVLVKKTIAAADKVGVKHIAVCGGVAANTGLRAGFAEHRGSHSIHMASPLLCTDNGVMIAVAGYYKHTRSPKKTSHHDVLDVDSTLAVQNW